MEWLVNALMGAENVYLEPKGANSKLIPLDGTVIRYLGDHLFVGGKLPAKSKASVDNCVVAIWLSDDSVIRVTGLECDVLEDGIDRYFNGSSLNGISKVLYSSSERDKVRVEIGGTL